MTSGSCKNARLATLLWDYYILNLEYHFNSVCNCYGLVHFIHQWLYSPLLGSGLFFSFVIFFTQTVGLLGRVISPPQGRHKNRINANTDTHALNGIRTHDPSVERAKTVRALERAATVVGLQFCYFMLISLSLTLISWVFYAMQQTYRAGFLGNLCLFVKLYPKAKRLLCGPISYWKKQCKFYQHDYVFKNETLCHSYATSCVKDQKFKFHNIIPESELHVLSEVIPQPGI
jgi:hypothetical protein